MLKRKRRFDERPATELVEEAFHLLRRAPGAALAAYFLGTLPFVLALLYFWSDMARSAFAEERLIPGSFALTLLFVWMKMWHAVFAQELLAHLAREPAPRWRPRWLLRAALYQSIVQPLGIILLPLSLPLLVALGWTYPFFANATVFAAGPVPDIKTLVRKSWRQMALWPIQSQNAMFMFKIFALFVAFNLATLVFGAPFLLKTLLGIETVVTRAPWTVLNSTVLASVLVLTWLCVDPVMKAFCVLRCFHGESLQTGLDLRSELKAYSAAPRVGVVAVILLLGQLMFAAPVFAADDKPPSTVPNPKSQIAPRELDRSIDRVIQQHEYSWRLPRETSAPKKEAQAGSLRGAIETLFKGVEDALKAVGRWMRDFIDWLTRQTPKPKTPGGGFDVVTAIKGLVFVLLIALAGALIWLVVRLWQRRPPVVEAAAEALAPVPDLADENTGADQLPEDGWARLGRDLLERGELRLALRAFYLGSLASLAERNLITLARFKSNRDYERELTRRAHALGGLPPLFAANVTLFERVWYGLHDITPDQLRDFASSVEQIKTGA